MATQNDKGGWDLTDADVAEVMEASGFTEGDRTEDPEPYTPGEPVPMGVCQIIVAQVSETRGRYQAVGHLSEIQLLLQQAAMDEVGFVQLTDPNGMPFLMGLSQIESVSEMYMTPVPKDASSLDEEHKPGCEQLINGNRPCTCDGLS